MGIVVTGGESSQSIQNQDELSEIRNNFNSSIGKNPLDKIFNRLDRLGRGIGGRFESAAHRTSNFFKQNKRRFIRSAAYLVLCILILAPTCSIIAAIAADIGFEGSRTQANHGSEFTPEVYYALGVNPGASPYEILGINRGATRGDVAAAHRRRIFNWHPDRNRYREKLATRVSQALNEARDAILNPPQPNIIFPGFYSAGRG